MRILILYLSLLQIALAAVIAIDYGTEWTKAALVKPGIPLEIVLTKDTKRKEQSVIAFKGQERLYGGDAANMVCRRSSLAIGKWLIRAGGKATSPDVLLPEESFGTKL